MSKTPENDFEEGLLRLVNLIRALIKSDFKLREEIILLEKRIKDCEFRINSLITDDSNCHTRGY